MATVLDKSSNGWRPPEEHIETPEDVLFDQFLKKVPEELTEQEQEDVRNNINAMPIAGTVFAASREEAEGTAYPEAVGRVIVDGVPYVAVDDEPDVPAEAKFESADGGWWVARLPLQTPDMYGAAAGLDVSAQQIERNTAAFRALMATGGGHVPAGAYVTDVLLADPGWEFTMTLAPDAVLRLRDDATEIPATRPIKTVLWLRGDRQHVIGGTLDANRDGQNMADYNGAGGTDGKAWYGLFVQGAPGARISDNVVRTRVINATEFGAYIQLCTRPNLDITVEDSGCGINVVDCDDISGRGLAAYNIDDAGADIFCHGVDIIRSSGRLDYVASIEQSSYRVPADGAKSEWFTGATIVGNSGLVISNMRMTAKDDGDMVRGLGASLLGNDGLVVENYTGRRWTSSALEFDGNVDSRVNGVDIDGEYLASSLFTAMHSWGLHSSGAGFYPDFTGRLLRPNRRCQIGPGTITGCLGEGVRLGQEQDVSLLGIRSFGNLDGANFDSQIPNASLSFPKQDITGGEGIRPVDCDFSGNERWGVVNTGSRDLNLLRCRINDNGQSLNMPSPGGLRNGGTFSGDTAGYFGGDNGDLKPDEDDRVGVVMLGCETADTQGRVGVGSFNPAEPAVVLVWRPNLYRQGQVVHIPGAGAGGSLLKTWIRRIVNDELHLAAPLETFPTVALTGTFSTSGTALTGSGSDLSDEVRGRCWITDGSVARVLRLVSSDTAGTLLTAFPSNLSGASLSIYQVDVETVRSQEYGIQTEDAVLDHVIATAHSFGPAGNAAANTDIAGEATISLAAWPDLPKSLHLGDFFAVNGSPAVGLLPAGMVRGWLLDAATTESIATVVSVPRGVTGARVRMRVRIANAGGGSGSVVLRQRTAVAPLGSSIDIAPTIASVGTIAVGAAGVVQEVLFPALGIDAGDMVRLGIDREGGNVADTLGNDLAVLGVTLEVV